MILFPFLLLFLSFDIASMYAAPPEITVEKSWVHASEGYDIELACIVHGDVTSDVSRCSHISTVGLYNTRWITHHLKFESSDFRNLNSIFNWIRIEWKWNIDGDNALSVFFSHHPFKKPNDSIKMKENEMMNKKNERTNERTSEKEK